MNNKIITFISTLILAALFMQPSIAQNHAGHHPKSGDVERFNDVSEEFRANLTEVVEVYIDGKEALLESDLKTLIAGFDVFTNKLEAIGIHGVSGDGHMAWMESYTQLTNHSALLTASNDIENARKEFHLLSEQLAIAVKKFGVDGVVYHQYCPMAIDSDGAMWLSSKEQIQNPYTPDTMLGCGDVIEKIES